jgi:integrase
MGALHRPDPTAGLIRPAKEAPRDRILFDGKALIGPDATINELGALVAALEADPSEIPVSRATRIALLLTALLGFRALEVSSLEWASVSLDGDAPSLTVTTSKTKAGLRTLPLPVSAVNVFAELKTVARKAAIYVFPAEEGAKRRAHMHPESLSRAFARACAKLKIEGVSVHDLRRTCLSGLCELGHESVAGRIAGHAARDVMGRHYDRSSRLEPMRAALSGWSDVVFDAAERHRSKKNETADNPADTGGNKQEVESAVG